MARRTGSGHFVVGSWLLALAGGCAAVPQTVQAQQVAPRDDRASGIDGRGFAGVRFAQAPVAGRLGFAGTRAWSWAEGSTRRLIIEGDVRAVIAGYTFRAKRAAVWMEGVVVDGRPATQVFAYFEEMGSAADPAGGVSMASERLPVKGVVEVEGPVQIAADLLIERAPGRGEAEALVSAGEQAMAKSLRKELGIAEPSAAAALLPRLSRKSTAVRPPRGPLLRPDQIESRAYSRPPEAGEAGSEPPTAARQRPSSPQVPDRTARPGPRVTGQDGGRAEASSPAGQPTGDQQAQRAPVTGDQTAGGPPKVSGPSEEPPRSGGVPIGGPPQTAENEPIFASDGIVTIAADDRVLVSGGAEESSVIATGGVVVQYEDPRGRVLTMRAQRAVVFGDPGKLTDLARLGADAIRGVYLEGGVFASDGTHHVNAPQVYYDFRANKAAMIDAVYWTFDEKRRLPLYVRAKSIRQESARQFVAKDARFTNTAFFDPELAIGATSVTITKQDDIVEPDPEEVAEGTAPPGPVTDTRTIVDARNITLQAMGIPVFYWPRYSGDPSQFPIKDFRVENRSGSGGAVRATLNAYTLLGLERPRDTELDLLTDFYFERGAGVGGRFKWNTAKSEGGLFAYTLPSDRGTDILKPGTRLNHDGEFRGLIVGEGRYRFNREWTLIAEASTISDATLVTALFPQMAENAREFTNRATLRRVDDNSYLSLQAKATFEDFLVNEWLLQSQGYTVNKLPEAFYARQADDLLANYSPGLLTWTHEYRAGRVEFVFDEEEARDRGFTRNSLSQRAFGINFDQSIADRLRGQGLFEDGVTRGDTRQELAITTEAGPIKIMPYAVGRVTAWDDSFEVYSPDNDDNVRLWSAAGVRLSTTVQRVYDDVDSRLLDIHRIRHLIEPNATVQVAGTSIEAGDLPTYDYEVESLADGGMARIGVTQTFQTQRGGPGQWHNVDLLTVSTDYVYSTDDATRKSPIPRFFDYRPELSSAGEFGVVDAVLRLTDATSIAGGVVYDFDANQQAVSNVGLLVRHAPGFTSMLDARYINPQDSTYLVFGSSYDLTEKYAASVGLTYDVNGGGFQSTVVEVRRRFSSMLLGVTVSFNDITGETSFGFVFQPYGAQGSGRFSGGGDVFSGGSGGFFR
ncbi:MAG TPA: hypothetical protein VD997_03270 [Phycisphaerales bacterium]|nr:hypothetical protein [Phycisphaerales bacterium]